MFNAKANLFRKLSSSSALETTLQKAVAVLAENDIPHIVVGGFAVQELGYARLTQDIDLVVPHVYQAKNTLLRNGFHPDPKNSFITVVDTNGVEVDFLKGGSPVLGQGIPLPTPKTVSDVPQIISLTTLINIKLSAGRMQDIADVGILIRSNHLPREYKVHPAVKETYEDTWDTAMAEQAIADLLGKEPAEEN